MKIKRISLIVTVLLMTVFCGLGLAEIATDSANAANTADIQTTPPAMGPKGRGGPESKMFPGNPCSGISGGWPPAAAL